jgi:hypothetical protein
MTGGRRPRKKQRRLDPDTFMSWFPVAMRYGALVGVFHQAVFADFDRPALLGLYGMMLGLSEVIEAMRER